MHAGCARPTTLNDFKKLLSQARPLNTGSRISAAELLKVSPKSSPDTSPNNDFNRNQLPPLLPPPASTAAKNRINGRVYRSPYRLESMYPPIVEGSEEDLAKSREKLTAGALVKTNEGTSTWV